jgi:hypothetical protein
VEVLLEVGIETIGERILDLTDRLRRGLRDHSHRVFGPLDCAGASGIVSVLPKAGEAEDVVARLHAHRVQLSASGGKVHGAPHFYNEEEEIDRVLEQAERGNLSVLVTLGRAMAHELGHLPMPSAGHTSRGLMCGKWSPSDFLLVAQGKLQFTSQQVEITRVDVSTQDRMQQAEALPGMAARS